MVGSTGTGSVAGAHGADSDSIRGNVGRVSGTLLPVAAPGTGAVAGSPRLLTPRRTGLWRDALRLAGRNGGLGVGPGRFGELSGPPPLSDGKPHSAPLQPAAEQGLVGVFLLVAAFCWVLHALWRTPRATPVALTAGTALTVLAVLASVGDALSFTAVTAGAGLLAGWATARPWTRVGAEADLPE